MSYFPPAGGVGLDSFATIVSVEQIAEISTSNLSSSPRVLAKYKIANVDSGVGSGRGVAWTGGYISADKKVGTGADTGRFGFFYSSDDISYSLATTRLNISGTSYSGGGFVLGFEQRLSGSVGVDAYVVVGLSTDAGLDNAFIKNARCRALLHVPAGSTVTRLV